jgi:hypothetical protein
MATQIPEGGAFLEAWNALPRPDRLRVRRLVRLGRPLAGREEAAVGVGYARFQRSRPWTRFFWLWFVPGLVVALGIAARIQPIVVGIVLALAAQAAFAHHNLRRAERTNAPVLE